MGTLKSINELGISFPKMSEAIVGCFKHVKSENFEEYLEAMDLPLPARKMMSSVDPIVEISVDGETWTITYKVAVRSMSISFELDQEFEEINPMTGEESKKTATLTEEDKLQIKDANSKGNFVSTFTPTDEGLQIDLHAEDQNITATRYLERIQE